LEDGTNALIQVRKYISQKG